MRAQAKLTAVPKPAEPRNDTAAATAAAPSFSEDLTRQLRSLAHDLSNSIETVMQATYLLGQAQLDDVNRRWLDLIDKAARDSARINREIREVLRAQSAQEKK